LLTAELYFYAPFCSYSGSVPAVLALVGLSGLQSEMKQGHSLVYLPEMLPLSVTVSSGKNEAMSSGQYTWLGIK
jgi:hypothetical protein